MRYSLLCVSSVARTLRWVDLCWTNSSAGVPLNIIELVAAVAKAHVFLLTKIIFETHSVQNRWWYLFSVLSLRGTASVGAVTEPD